MNLFFRASFVWCIIVLIEIANGTFRTLFFTSSLGDSRARQLSVCTGSVLFFLFVRRNIEWLIPPSYATPSSPYKTIAQPKANRRLLLLVGASWMVSMLFFELWLGHYIFKKSWDVLLEDFNIAEGGILSFGMLLLGLCPMLAAICYDRTKTKACVSLVRESLKLKQICKKKDV
eukprot:TRINITY_DN1439_c0_g1_i1.p1 TRINITY_DN1439_c0_g1~~TRINITY_DN1439_c0_g1_i1.p1  ORF type:complete len:174 (-),score=14.20 TRINITY_DN1439_c0_g1_i1:435-956(-)